MVLLYDPLQLQHLVQCQCSHLSPMQRATFGHSVTSLGRSITVRAQVLAATHEKRGKVSSPDGPLAHFPTIWIQGHHIMLWGHIAAVGQDVWLCLLGFRVVPSKVHGDPGPPGPQEHRTKPHAQLELQGEAQTLIFVSTLETQCWRCQQTCQVTLFGSVTHFSTKSQTHTLSHTLFIDVWGKKYPAWCVQFIVLRNPFSLYLPCYVGLLDE